MHRFLQWPPTSPPPRLYVASRLLPPLQSHTTPCFQHLLTLFPRQAASAIESFKIESPVKKLDFGDANKENILADEVAAKKLVNKEEAVKPVAEEKKLVAATIKDAEADEPLLQENPQRFVLFPIKYHEVSSIPSRHTLTRRVASLWPSTRKVMRRPIGPGLLFPSTSLIGLVV